MTGNILKRLCPDGRKTIQIPARTGLQKIIFKKRIDRSKIRRDKPGMSDSVLHILIAGQGFPAMPELMLGAYPGNVVLHISAEDGSRHRDR